LFRKSKKGNVIFRTVHNYVKIDEEEWSGKGRSLHRHMVRTLNITERRPIVECTKWDLEEMFIGVVCYMSWAMRMNEMSKG